MLRRLYHDQPDSFAFTSENRRWAEAQITKYPAGREASAIIPLLWRAQEQEGWLTRAAIEHVADMLGLAYIRALEVASFYFMFQLQPVGSVAHFQICGTTSCMICGAEDLMEVCKQKIAPHPHQVSADGKFSWEEVECLGACANAPMAQIGKDYYEDLTKERFAEIIDEIAAGKVPTPGPQTGRYASEPLHGLTSLKDFDSGHTKYNASVQLATDLGETIKRIDGTEVPLTAPWGDQGGRPQGRAGGTEGEPAPPAEAQPAAADRTADSDRITTAPPAAPQGPLKPARPLAGEAKLAEDEAKSTYEAPDDAGGAAGGAGGPTKPDTLTTAREGRPDDLKMIRGIGPKLEQMLNSMGVFHYDQIAAWQDAEIAWVDENLEGFKGRVTRDDWVTQAGRLASGEETEFSQRAKKDGTYED
jgi:NADH-quinone oxidoreductase subunit E